MSTKIDGKQIAAEIKTNLAERVNKLKAQGIQPGLGTLLVGEDPGSMKYVAGKHADCQEVGITSVKKELPADASFDDIAAAVRELNEDPACTGFIVQLPLPKGINENAIIDMIDPAKDADGMHPYNLGELVLHVRGDISTPLPCTPRGVLELLDAYDIDLNGKEVCVLGRGITIGRTIGLMLTRNAVNATVTLCHRYPGCGRPHAPRRRDRCRNGFGRIRDARQNQGRRRAGRRGRQPRLRRRSRSLPHQGRRGQGLLRQGLRLHPQPRRRGPHDLSHAPSQRRGNGRTTRLEFPRKFGQSCLYCEYLYACRVCV